MKLSWYMLYSNRMVLVHSNITGNRSFTVLNTNVEDLVVVKYVAYIFIEVHSQLSVLQFI